MTGALRRIAAVSGVVVLAVAGVVFVLSVLRTSSAQVSASTETRSFFASGTIALDRPESSAELLFDDDRLHPGRAVEGCVDVDYSGSIPGNIHLFARPVSTTGLENHIDLELAIVESPDGCGGTEGSSARTVYSGGLDDLWRDHDRYDRGVVLATGLSAGSRLSIRASAELDDDNAAQGLTSLFALIVEVRP